jgi:O-antigen ligase
MLKLLFVISTLVALLVLDRDARFIRAYAATLVFGSLGLCALALANSDPSDLARGVRFSIESLGVYGFNTLGFVLAIGITLAAYLSGEARDSRGLALWLLAAIVLLAFLIMTNSRGPAVSLIAALVVYIALLAKKSLPRAGVVALCLVIATYALGVSMPTLLSSYAALRVAVSSNVPALIVPGRPLPGATPPRPSLTPSPTAVPATASYLERFDVTRDPTLSGRTILWSKLLLDLLRRPDAMILGFGLGSIDWQVGDTHYRSAHNTYLEVLYFTGAIGLAIFTLGLGMIARRIVNLSGPPSRLAWSVFVVLLVSMAVDSYWGASQLGWLQSVLLYASVTAGVASRSMHIE